MSRATKKGRTIGGPTAQDAADNFNRDFPVGSAVEYWSTLPFGPSKKTRVRDAAFVSNSGEPVCFVEGVSGYVSIWHIKEMLAGKTA